MALTLYMHPLSSYCHKALIALYENAVAFEPHVVDLGDPAARDAFRRLWPIGKFPVLHDDARAQTIPESTCIIEYLARHYPGPVQLIPNDPELAARVRSTDRFYDLHVHDPMQRIVGDRLRPADNKDPFGVAAAEAMLVKSYDLIDAEMAGRTWAVGDVFTLADCAAAPPLFFANKLVPFGERHNLSAYFRRLSRRPSVARAFNEAEPFLKFFPG